MSGISVAQLRKQFPEYSTKVFNKVIHAVDANHDKVIDADDAFEAWGVERSHDEARVFMGLAPYQSWKKIDYEEICSPGLIYTPRMPEEEIPAYCASYEGFTFEDADNATLLWQSLGLFIQADRSVMQAEEANGLFPICRSENLLFVPSPSKILLEVELKGERGRSETDMFSTIQIGNQIIELLSKYKNVTVQVEGVATRDSNYPGAHQRNLRLANRRGAEAAEELSNCLREITTHSFEIKVEPREYSSTSWEEGPQAPYYGDYPGARIKVYGEPKN